MLDDTRQQDEAAAITPEWIKEVEDKLASSMTDMDDCIQRLRKLCGSLFDLNSSKTRKEEAGETHRRETDENQGFTDFHRFSFLLSGNPILRVSDDFSPS